MGFLNHQQYDSLIPSIRPYFLGGVGIGEDSHHTYAGFGIAEAHGHVLSKLGQP